MKTPIRKIIRRMMLQELKDMGLRFFVPKNLQEYAEINGGESTPLDEAAIKAMLQIELKAEKNEGSNEAEFRDRS